MYDKALEISSKPIEKHTVIISIYIGAFDLSTQYLFVISA
jgi:hypothetical protein